MKSVDILNKYLSKIGAKIVRYPEYDLRRRKMLLDYFKINKVFDVGANSGQYAMKMRQLGFDGEIISFEPLSKAYETLKQNTRKYKNWKAINIALGDKDEETFINVAGNSYSSSLLEMLPDHINAAPESTYIGKEKIRVNKLDTIISDFYNETDRVYLKIDTQGYEKQVLAGSVESLRKIKGIQLEMSIVPLYKEEMLFSEMVMFLENKGFILHSLENGFSLPRTGQLLQVDGLFFSK